MRDPLGLDVLLLAILVFCVAVIVIRDDSPIHEAKRDKRPILPVRPLDVPIVVINLNRNTDRLKTFMNFISDSDFKEQNILRLPAIDGKKVDIDRVVAKDAMGALVHTIMTESRTGHEQLTVGAVGCYLSHMAAWETLLASGKPYGLVFEDDAEVGKHALRRALSSLEQLPDDWDVLLLGTACLSRCPRVRGKPFKTVTHFVRFHAYAISRKACAFLTSKEAGMLPMSMQVDWKISELASKNKLKVFSTDKFLVDSGYQGTEIQRPVYNK